MGAQHAVWPQPTTHIRSPSKITSNVRCLTSSWLPVGQRRVPANGVCWSKKEMKWDNNINSTLNRDDEKWISPVSREGKQLERAKHRYRNHPIPLFPNVIVHLHLNKQRRKKIQKNGAKSQPWIRSKLKIREEIKKKKESYKFTFCPAKTVEMLMHNGSVWMDGSRDGDFFSAFLIWPGKPTPPHYDINRAPPQPLVIIHSTLRAALCSVCRYMQEFWELCLIRFFFVPTSFVPGDSCWRRSGLMRWVAPSSASRKMRKAHSNMGVYILLCGCVYRLERSPVSASREHSLLLEFSKAPIYSVSLSFFFMQVLSAHLTDSCLIIRPYKDMHPYVHSFDERKARQGKEVMRRPPIRIATSNGEKEKKWIEKEFSINNVQASFVYVSPALSCFCLASSASLIEQGDVLDWWWMS